MVSKFLLLFALLFVASSGPKVVAQSQGSREFLDSGNALVRQERYGEAIPEYLKVEPNQSDLYSQSLYNIGVCYYELQQTERAISYYGEALAVRKFDYPRAAYALGVALEDLGRTTEARDAFIRASKRPSSWLGPALFKLGVIAFTEGQLNSASDLFRRASLSSGAHRAASHNNLGVTLARLGRLSEAEKEFQYALDQATEDYEDAQHNLDLCRALRQTATTGKTRRNFELTANTF